MGTTHRREVTDLRDVKILSNSNNITKEDTVILLKVVIEKTKNEEYKTNLRDVISITSIVTKNNRNVRCRGKVRH